MNKKKLALAGLLALLLSVAGFECRYLMVSKNNQIDRVVDGDTLLLENGKFVRLLGINAPDRGDKNYDEATVALTTLVEGKRFWLESDRYPEDMYGRTLSWMWIDCEAEPEFTEFDYMKLSKNQSKPGLTENPEGCKQGKLINEEMLKQGLARTEFYKDRGEMKYQKRILKAEKTAETF